MTCEDDEDNLNFELALCLLLSVLVELERKVPARFMNVCKAAFYSSANSQLIANLL